MARVFHPWTSWEPVGLAPYETVQARLLDRTLQFMIALGLVSVLVLVGIAELRATALLSLAFVAGYGAVQRMLRAGDYVRATRWMVWSITGSLCLMGWPLGGLGAANTPFFQVGVLMALVWLPFAEAVAVTVTFVVVLVAYYLAPPPPIFAAAQQQVGLVCANIAAMIQASVVVGAAVEAYESAFGASTERAAEADAARQAANEAARAKTSFLAMMSHELRTPLNAIIGYAGLLREDDDAPREELGRVEAAGRQLLELVTDVLDLARLESAPPVLAAIELREVVGATVDGLGVRVQVGGDGCAAYTEQRTVEIIVARITRLLGPDDEGVLVSLAAGAGQLTVRLARAGGPAPAVAAEAATELDLVCQLAERIGGQVRGPATEAGAYVLALPAGPAPR